MSLEESGNPAFPGALLKVREGQRNEWQPDDTSGLPKGFNDLSQNRKTLFAILRTSFQNGHQQVHK
jgi:hypothetical protein